MVNTSSELYNDDETLTFDQVVANLVNVTYRSDGNTYQGLEEFIDYLDSIDTNSYTQQQKEYIFLAKRITTKRLELAVDIKEILTMATNHEYSIDECSRVETISDESGERRLTTQSVCYWADELLLANAKPERVSEKKSYCDPESLPSPAESVKITLASAIELLAKQEECGVNGKPKIGALATKLKVPMYGQTYENLRKLLNECIKTKKAYLINKK